MYSPAVFTPTGSEIGWRIVQEHPLGLLLLQDGTIAPLPLICDEGARTLRGHLARANPASAMPGGDEVRVVFLGPHAYVSPMWYANPREQVPTWNYVVVQMTGRISWLGREETRQVLDDTCARFEAPGGFAPDWVDGPLLEEMMDEIAGFRIDVHEVRPKLKLSQNRSPEDWERVRRRFAEAPSPGPELAEWMAIARKA